MIELHNIILVLGYDLNFILLKQFRKNKIKYYNNLYVITLIKDKKIITFAKK